MLTRRGFCTTTLLATGAGALPVRGGAAPEEEAVPPGIDAATIEHAERLAGLEFTPEERTLIAETVRELVGFEGNIVGQRSRQVAGHEDHLGVVGIARASAGHAIARAEVSDAVRYFEYHPC